MRVVGIMTCFNRKTKTINSIKRLIDGNSDVNFEFIVVDDNSSDGTAQSLSTFENVTVLKGDGQLYYSGGMHKGIGYVKDRNIFCDYILFFNDDVDFYDGIIHRMISYADVSNEIIVGATESIKGKISYGGVQKSSNFKPAFNIVMSNETKKYCDTFCANCVLIPYGTFKILNNMDNKFKHSLGDYDYGLTASENGIPISVTNFFVGSCQNNPVSANWLDNTKSRKERLLLKESPKGLPREVWFYFVKKHYGVLSAIIFSTTQYLKILLGR